MASSPRADSQLAILLRSSAAFQARFARVSCLTLGVVFPAVLVASLVIHEPVWVVTAVSGILVCGAAYALSFRGDGVLGRRVFVYGVLLMASFNGAVDAAHVSRLPMYFVVATFLVALASFLLTRLDLLITMGSAAVTLGVVLLRASRAEGADPSAIVAYAVAGTVVLAQCIAFYLFTANARASQGKLRTYVEEIDRVMAHAERIAQGDLAGAEEGTSEVAETIRAMQAGLRDLVTRTRQAAAALSSSAQELSSMARQQEHGAVEQASAVAQVNRTLAALREGSSEAARSTEEVFQSVELTQKRSEVVAERAAALSLHTRRISALLETIKGIANKSEILALNAALEGARAGEAGRGFSLVASQMQRLAESVMGSVRDVRALVEDIDAATAATLAATDESTRLSAKATGAARQIRGTLHQQQRSAEQVSSAMADIQQVAAQVTAGSAQSLSATQDLTRLSAELTKAIERFQL